MKENNFSISKADIDSYFNRIRGNGDYKKILQDMGDGNLGGKYYQKIYEAKMAKLPKWVKTFLSPIVDANWIYHKLMSLLLN